MPNPLVDRSWGVLRHLVGAHTVAYRATGGLIGHRVPGAPPMLLLDHIGAKSGKVRTTPLAYLADGDDVVLVASKGGHPRHPAWFHNLMANPETTIQVGSERRAVFARVADDQERARLWPEVVELYGGYQGYQERTDREIPLVVLEPRGGRPAA
jgi:F420H(2)-dependent quinone reductase